MLYLPIICIIYWVTIIAVSTARARYFNKDFMKQFDGKIGEIQPPLGGAPDDGNG